MCKRLAVEIDLRVLLRRCVGDAVGAGKQSVQIVEAAILRVDDDDVLDLAESRSIRRRCGATGERCGECDYECGGWTPLHVRWVLIR